MNFEYSFLKIHQPSSH